MISRREFLQSLPTLGLMMATTSLTTLTAGHAFAKSKLTPTDTSRHPPMSYRGSFDDNRVEFANGGIANGNYVDWLSGQPNEATIFEPQEGVWSIVGYMLGNFTFVQSETGLIAFDAGSNIGMGRDILALLRTRTELPIVAIIYSHHHYTAGARAYAEDRGTDLPIYGHPDVDRNLLLTAGELGPMQFRRASLQLGFYLPHDGPDAYVGPAEPTFDDPELQANGHLPVTHPVSDGEEVVIDGRRVIFHHAVGDTRDSLIVHFPDQDLVLHNTNVTPMAFSMYTLRGDFYRAPDDMIASIDKMRAIRPAVLVGCHGVPLFGDEAHEVMTAHRDYYAFIYNQSIRAINQGMTPEQMVETIQIPDHLAKHPWLYPGYVEHEYNIRGIYRGIVGWFAEDTADLHPPTDAELGNEMIQGFGGVDAVIERAREVFDQGKYNLTAKLMSFVIGADPTNGEARQLKADASRAMGQTAQAGIQARNFFLTHARHLEGKLDWTQPPEIGFFTLPGVDLVMSTPPGTYLKLLQFNVDPVGSANVNAVAKFNFTDLGQSWAVHVRRGVVEITETVPETVDVTIEFDRKTWAQIALRQMSLADAVQRGLAAVSGDQSEMAAILGSFDKIPTAQPEPEQMNG
ncbi:alkyl sulfatase dimerization domain-containing protein [uncultured Shimia sp.]|uniref:alkyl sulfatase dimerization domain-containing protein n=1 Tax=uncultured Shimia sp. TaxID=573152 RepID=UPI0025F8BF05|nr:alkyl sulfatase dimerization domain-containing protein [uncultured Shimia sp.]